MGRFRSYIQMVKDAIKSLGERDGSSQHAIKKHIIAHERNTFEQRYLRAALKNGVESGVLVMVKRSFKLVIKVRFNLAFAGSSPRYGRNARGLPRVAVFHAWRSATTKLEASVPLATYKHNSHHKPRTRVFAEEGPQEEGPQEEDRARSPRRTRSPRRAGHAFASCAFAERLWYGDPDP